MYFVRLVSFKVVIILFALLLLLPSDSQGQRNKSKHSKAYHKSHYASVRSADKQCFLLFKKKYSKPKKRSQGFLASIFGTSKSKPKPKAEVDPNDTPPPAKAKPQAIAKKEAKDEVPKKKLEERHITENEVLAKNNLPQPTSEEHKKIRKKVEQNLKAHEQGEPIELDPLYFIYDDAEFSVVNMEPFLVAVEYALQGRMVLIEGHTDNHGNEEYNVKLSMQRVEKIRKIMHEMGVPDDQISVVGYGEEVAGHDNTSEEGRQKNRRVDFKVF